MVRDSERLRLTLRPSLSLRACSFAMSFKRFVEVGRIGLITYGPDSGKLCTIINVIDGNRVLVDGPEPVTGVHRHALNLKRLQLTDIKIAAKLNASEKCAAPLPVLPVPLLATGGMSAVMHGNHGPVLIDVPRNAALAFSAAQRLPCAYHLSQAAQAVVGVGGRAGEVGDEQPGEKAHGTGSALGDDRL